MKQNPPGTYQTMHQLRRAHHAALTANVHTSALLLDALEADTGKTLGIRKAERALARFAAAVNDIRAK